MRRVTLFISLVIMLLLIIGCTSEDDYFIANSIETDSTIVSSANIGEMGGSFKFGDKVKLDVPQGSLSSDVLIKITSIKNNTGEGNPGKELLILEPEGTTFKIPIHITLNYEFTLTQAETLSAFTCRDGEWEPIEILKHDKQAKQVIIEVSHFSIIALFTQGYYLVVDIPGKYLLKGDLLFTLTSAFGAYWWFPGHVGLYTGTIDPYSIKNDGYTFIESTPPNVRFGTIATDFIDRGDHLFMGARRYNLVLNYLERQQIAKFASAQLNKRYSLVGQNTEANSFSCVGLTEASFEYANLNIIPEFMEIPWSIPYDQFCRTNPVDRIAIRQGDRIEIKVYCVHQGLMGAYEKSSDGVSLENFPSGSNWTNYNDHWTFSWIPTNQDANKNFTMTFKVEKSVDGEITSQEQSIYIMVLPSIKSGFVQDIEGNIYKTVEIGTKTWMAENLKAKTYLNGDNIETTNPPNLDISELIYESPKYQWAYDGDENYVSTFGRLYTLYVATDSRKICPVGWHVPTDIDWETLINSVGGDGKKLTPTGENTWFPSPSGFEAIPVGNRSSNSFQYILQNSYYWSATEYSPDYPQMGKCWRIDADGGMVETSFYGLVGLSIRCVKDN